MRKRITLGILIILIIGVVLISGCLGSESTPTNNENTVQLTEKPTEQVTTQQPKFKIGDVVHTSNTDGFLITALDNQKDQYEVLEVTKYNDEWGFYSDPLDVLHMSYKKDNDDFYFVEEHFDIVDKDDALDKLPVHPISFVDTL